MADKKSANHPPPGMEESGPPPNLPHLSSERVMKDPRSPSASTSEAGPKSVVKKLSQEGISTSGEKVTFNLMNGITDRYEPPSNMSRRSLGRRTSSNTIFFVI